ncbi:hypothetical protein [Actinosynnema sp. NPDC020468]|uniref:hypothetical protein n=1 Tax=Actinosynnema sp. NPDC020468 TaxID=3154488 RepID=UPI0033E54E7B
MNLASGAVVTSWVKIHGDAPFECRTSAEEVELSFGANLDLVFTREAAGKVAAKLTAAVGEQTGHETGAGTNE